MRRPSRHLIGLTLGLGVVVWSGQVWAACSTQTLNGSYVVTLAGENAFGNTFSAFGAVTFNGAGRATVALTVNERGVGIYPLAESGTYTLGSSCLAALTLVTPFGAETYSGSVLYNGLVILFANVGDVGIQAAGLALRP